jgi:hypothetical protein
MNSTRNLEQMIRLAFNCKLDVGSFPADGYAQLKWKLSSLDEASAKEWLPLVLIQEIHSAPTMEGDAVVYFLDGNLSARQGESGIEQLRKTAHEAFRRYSDDQAHAVRGWLEEVAELHYQELCEDDIESAISYWRGRRGKP